MFWAKAACDLRPPIATLAFFCPFTYLWLSLSSRFSLRSSVLSPRAPLLLLWFLLLLLLVVLLLQPLLSLHVMLVVFVLLFFFVGVLFLSSADLTATVMVLHSGRSPQGEGRRKCDTSSTRVDAEVCVCISSQLPLATSLQMISNRFYTSETRPRK